jgi:hypothetical protein
MEGTNQIRILSALIAGKDTPVPIGQEAGRAPEPVCTFSLLPLAGTESGFLGRTASSVVDIQNELFAKNDIIRYLSFQSNKHVNLNPSPM